jgi:hypothetical protein
VGEIPEAAAASTCGDSRPSRLRGLPALPSSSSKEYDGHSCSGDKGESDGLDRSQAQEPAESAEHDDREQHENDGLCDRDAARVGHSRNTTPPPQRRSGGPSRCHWPIPTSASKLVTA